LWFKLKQIYTQPPQGGFLVAICYYMNMKIEPKTLKGFRDFLPKEARKRQYVIDTLRKVFESYGFEPLETPALEYAEILEGKYGEEGERLMYKFEDKGGRKVALRYDQTVPLARVVAQYGSPGSPQLPLPFKRYQISNVWRGENPQKGRFREFLQCDIDTVGTSSLLADAEILELVYESYKKLGLDVIIKINDRRLLSTISTKALTILDKLNKIGEEEVINELEQIGMNSEDAKKILSETRSFKASEELREIKNLAIKLGCPGDVVKFEQLLIRGLDYYTGLVMEVFLKDSDSNLSLGGGGRYDDLIGMFSGKSIPAVGFAFGFDRIIDAMEKQGLFQNLENGTKVLVTIFSPELLDRSIKVCEVLNSANINQELYVDPVARMDKQLKYADQKGIPYVVIVGPKEAESGSATVKNLKTGEQTTLPVKDLPDFLK